MNLDYGLSVFDSYMKADKQRRIDEYDQSKRDAELSALGDKTEADRSGYQLRSGQNRANTELLPEQAANAKKKLGLESASLDADAERQPDEIKTKAANAKIGLANVENEQSNLPFSLAVKNNALRGQLMTSNAELANLPGKLQRLAVQGALDEQGQADVVLGTMGQLISRQDKAGALKFANAVAKQRHGASDGSGNPYTDAELVDIQPIRAGQNGATRDGYNFVDSTGKSEFVPLEAIAAARGKLKSGEYQFIHTSDGSVFAGNKQTGAVSQAHQGDPKTLRAQHTPAEVQTMEWLINKGVAKDANSAWEQVRSAREKTRNAFVMDYVSKNALPGADTNKLSDDAGRIYDTLRQNQGPTSEAAKPSNSAQPVGGAQTQSSGSAADRARQLLGLGVAQQSPQMQQAPTQTTAIAPTAPAAFAPAIQSGSPSSPQSPQNIILQPEDATPEGVARLEAQQQRASDRLTQAQSDLRYATSLSGRGNVTQQQQENIKAAVLKLAQEYETAKQKAYAAKTAIRKARADAAYTPAGALKDARSGMMDQRLSQY
jgi:hypothetical protein